MRSFFGSLILILVMIALAGTFYYHLSTNSNLECELHDIHEPSKTTEVVNVRQMNATHQEESPAPAAPAPPIQSPANELP